MPAAPVIMPITIKSKREGRPILFENLTATRAISRTIDIRSNIVIR